MSYEVIEKAPGQGYVVNHTHDGTCHTYYVSAASGAFLQCLVCGAPWTYQKNGMKHSHYLLFERDMLVHDGKYLTKIGHKI